MSLFKRRNLLLVLALVLAVILAATVAVRLRSVSRVADIVQALPSGVELALQDVSYTHTEAGVVRWRLKAERAERLVSEKRLAVKNPELTFYDETGAFQALLTAEEGDADKDFSELHVRGKVVVESSQGYQLFADELVYKQLDRKIYSDTPVEFVIDNLIVKGHGLILDVENSKMTILDGVTAVLPVTKSRRLLD